MLGQEILSFLLCVFGCLECANAFFFFAQPSTPKICGGADGNKWLCSVLVWVLLLRFFFSFAFGLFLKVFLTLSVFSTFYLKLPRFFVTS